MIENSIRFALIMLIQNTLLGQATFQKSYGDPNVQSEATDLIECPGGYLLAGFTVNMTTGRDGLLLRLDLQGNVVWEKSFDQNNFDEFKAVAQTGDGGFIAFGNTRPQGAANDLWLIKVSGDGALLWQKQFHRPNSGMDGLRIQAITGGYLISGNVGIGNVSSPFIIQLDNDGNNVWSKTYEVPSGLMSIGYLTDSLLYVGGVAALNGSILGVNPQNGLIEKQFLYQAPGTESLDYIAPTADGNLVVGDYAQPFWPMNNLYSWIQKITPSGTVVWSRIYDFSDPIQYYGPIISTSDGGFLVCPGNGSNSLSIDANMMKLDQDGHVKWCHTFGKPNGQEWFLKAIETSDGGFIAAGLTVNGGPGRPNVFVVKTDARGRIAGCCPNIRTVLEVDFSTTFLIPTFNTGPFVQGTPAFGTDVPISLPAQTHACLNAQPALLTEIALCPGETVTLGGQTYSQPDTVMLEIPAVNGNCDTLATYILTNALEGQNSQISIQCPQNIALEIPEGNVEAAVPYPVPTAVSDCSCSGLDVSKTSGGASGSTFPLGTNTVCWMATDACGSTKNCCFTVNITEESSSCDTKTTACLKWELVSIKQDAANQRHYTIRLTNTCAAKLAYAYIGLPSGMTALNPLNNSIYTTLSGNTYEVRNPNYSPVFGIRFKPKTGSLNGGQSDIFRFSLPQQASFDHLYVAGRLENAAFYEAHLNTFACPIGSEGGAANRSAEAKHSGSDLVMAPNPAKSGSSLQFQGGLVAAGELLMTPITGQQIFKGEIIENQVFMSEVLPVGVYVYRLVENGVISKIGKLVVIE